MIVVLVEMLNGVVLLKKLLNMLIGLVVGLLLGIVYVVIWMFIDCCVYDVDFLIDELGLISLGLVNY